MIPSVPAVYHQWRCNVSYDLKLTDRIDLPRFYPLEPRGIVIRIVRRTRQRRSDRTVLKSTDKLGSKHSTESREEKMETMRNGNKVLAMELPFLMRPS